MSDLIDREALKDAVTRYAGEPIKKKDRKCQSICLDMLGTIDAQPTASPWRRVEEELPKEEHRTYLVYTDTGYMCSCRWTNNVYGIVESDRWGWCLADIPQFQKVDYWMPIEPPKEDA